MSLDNSITCQAAKGSNYPLLENNIWCPLTQFDERHGILADDDCPLVDEDAHWPLR